MPGAMDTCIIHRTGHFSGAICVGAVISKVSDSASVDATLFTLHGVAYLQAGGGIVFDSDPYDEYIETINKLGANIACIHRTGHFSGAICVGAVISKVSDSASVDATLFTWLR
jgi:anthranilate/para-aminobenzoate synthase component I